MSTSRLVFLITIIACGRLSLAQETAPDKLTPLPFPEQFDANKYLGKWYELARLPSPSQPKNTLATAEYSRGASDNEVLVKNTAFDAQGKQLQTIQGKARILEGNPPRLAVGFGPQVPQRANYYVLEVDQGYNVAMVGTPDRKALWILSRKPTITRETLDRLIEMAKDANFATDKLITSDWNSALADATEIQKGIQGTWKYVSGERDGMKLGEGHFDGQSVEISKETITLKGDEFTFVIGYELIPDTNPQSLKMTIKEGPFGAGQKSNGIIALTKDELKLCYSPMGDNTPTDFRGDEGLLFFVLQRAP